MSVWNRDKVLHLINLYKEKSELWNCRNKNYHVRNKKQDAWLEIAEEMNSNAGVVKAKMSSLLSSFRKERARNRNKDIYISKWFAFSSFAFLMNKKNGRKNVTKQKQNNTETDSGVGNDIEAVSVLEVDVSEAIKTESADLEEVSTHQNTEETVTRKRKLFLSPKRRQFKKRAQQEDPRISAAYDILRKVGNSTSDESFTFGQHVAAKLQKFDSRLRSVVMHLMNNIIFDAEMGKYNNCANSSGQTLVLARKPSVHASSSSSYAQEPSPSPTYSGHSNQNVRSQGLPNSQLNVAISHQPNSQFSEIQTPLHDPLILLTLK